MTFNFFNKPFNISSAPELSGGSFTFNWKSITAEILEPKYLKDSDGLQLISSDTLTLLVRG